MTSLLAQIDSLGRFVTKNLEYTARVLLMVYLSLRATALDKAQGFRQIVGVISAQIYFTGFQALPLISVLALGVGSIMILQSLSNLSLLGGTQMIGNFLIVMVLREAGPLLVALVVIARSGTAVASEVGNMRANREIEALESMGINPMSFIVFPRVLGGIISVLGLAFYFNVIALIGGFLVTRFVQDMPFSFYTDSLMKAFAKEDVLIFLLKNGFSGMIIFVVSCYQGLSVKRSPHEVPQVTTQAVVNSIIFVVIFNLMVSALFYLNQLRSLGVV
ncbi:MlaE family ABC transporter permease [Bdellovibrio bacteriovorus]|uniref:MlaE family ABC transporter permease n=1 Tax=Bdellovibrio TaxID=958 RepID=UPI0035A99AFF